jgi:hypothetical protein
VSGVSGFVDHVPMFHVLGFEHVFVVAEQPTWRQDRFLRQTAGV